MCFRRQTIRGSVRFLTLRTSRGNLRQSSCICNAQKRKRDAKSGSRASQRAGAYERILELFADANTPLVLTEQTGYDLHDMRQPELEKITQLRLEMTAKELEPCQRCAISLMHYRLANGRRLPCRRCIPSAIFPSRAELEFPLLYAINLREVYLRLGQGNSQEKLRFITGFPNCVRGCKFLTKLSVEIPVVAWKLPSIIRGEVIEMMLQHLHKSIGVRGELQGRVEERTLNAADVYVWASNEGETMDWTKEQALPFPTRCMKNLRKAFEQDRETRMKKSTYLWRKCTCQPLLGPGR